MANATSIDEKRAAITKEMTSRLMALADELERGEETRQQIEHLAQLEDEFTRLIALRAEVHRKTMDADLDAWTATPEAGWQRVLQQWMTGEAIPASAPPESPPRSSGRAPDPGIRQGLFYMNDKVLYHS